jgi:predicted alpha/beta hydrolase
MTGVISRESGRARLRAMAEDAPAAQARLGPRWLVVGRRPIPGVRAWRTLLRTAHLIAFGTLFGGHVYGIAPDRLAPALAATLGTGAALMLLEVVHAPIWLVQVRGAATGLKIALVVVAQAVPSLAVPLLTLTIAIGAVSSHMPGRWRYHSLLHGRVVGPREKG